MSEIAAEMMAEGSGEPVEQVLGLLDNQAGYATPKLDARGSGIPRGEDFTGTRTGGWRPLDPARRLGGCG